MASGIEVTNSLGLIQITEAFKNSRLIASGTSSTGTSASIAISMPDALQNPPIVLARPSLPNCYVGGSVIGDGYSAAGYTGVSGSGVFVWGKCTFDYAIFSNTGTAIRDSVTHGFEVYDGSGQVVYSSKERHPQVKAIYYRPASAGGTNWPMSYSLSGFTSMPWILMNTTIMTWNGVGWGTSPSCCGAKVNSTFTTLTTGFCSWPSMNEYPTPNSYKLTDPYVNLSCYFGVATYG